MIFRQLFDHESATYTYLLADEGTGDAVLIDPVDEQANRDAGLLEELGLRLIYTLETHVHADHISASAALRKRTGSRSIMSENAGAGCADRTVADGDRIVFGAHQLEARLTPGHTNGCVSFVDHENHRVFSGDALLIRGCGRTDFQQGNARTLYRSVHEKLFSLPDSTQLFPGHDYKGRTSSRIGEEKIHNARLGGGRTEDDFVVIMSELNLARPAKIDVAVPANLRCGSVEAWAPIERAGANVPEVHANWVREHAANVRLIDVREQDEFVGELGHIDGAELVPMATLASTAETWPREEKLVVVCRSGARSGRASLELEAMGFSRVASMGGGMILWNDLPELASVGACGQ